LHEIPVVLNNQIVGLLHQKDVLHWLQFHSEMKS
jgi:signal-transduction protein with cAMP-binding, CBS, and nucleotidyltransferase domain